MDDYVCVLLMEQSYMTKTHNHCKGLGQYYVETLWPSGPSSIFLQSLKCFMKSSLHEIWLSAFIFHLRNYWGVSLLTELSVWQQHTSTFGMAFFSLGIRSLLSVAMNTLLMPFSFTARFTCLMMVSSEG